MILGVVADDLTGATDIGSMSAKAGHRTHVYPDGGFEDPAGASVCVIDTDSRFDDPPAAYAKVRQATERLAAAGCTRFHKKTCSVFRGNVGAEFDAMLDALGEEFAVVVLGFPKNGRTTVDGVHYVNGVKLEDSPFRNDPVHPARSSLLVEILGGQTRRRVQGIGREIVDRGPQGFAEALSAARGRGGYAVLDVVDQEALAVIARAVDLAEVRVLCGASGLIEELALRWPAAEATTRPRPVKSGTGTLIVAGSLTPQTAAQVEHLRDSGVQVLELDTLSVFDGAAASAAVADLSRTATAKLRQGVDVVVRAAAGREAVERTQAAGAERGLGSAATGRLVSEALAEVAARCRKESRFARLVVAGGDTSAAVCRRLGVGVLSVGAEVAPGVPVCETVTGEPLRLVLKSGSFGAPDLLLSALEHLREGEPCTT